jgi:hypothetical protein
MTPEERELLTRSIKLSEENNKMLRGLRRRARFASFIHIVYWLIIISSLVVSYYAVRPFIEPLMKSVSGIQNSVNNAQDIANKFLSPDLPSLPVR